jgi:hypothetical protein
MDVTIDLSQPKTPGIARARGAAWCDDAVSMKRGFAPVNATDANGSCGAWISGLVSLVHTRSAEGILSKVEVQRP